MFLFDLKLKKKTISSTTTTPAARKLLNEAVYLKAQCFQWSKLRKESAEEYLMRFLDVEIKCLWPKGWMSSKILYKESQEGHCFVTYVESCLSFHLIYT